MTGDRQEKKRKKRFPSTRGRTRGLMQSQSGFAPTAPASPSPAKRTAHAPRPFEETRLTLRNCSLPQRITKDSLSAGIEALTSTTLSPSIDTAPDFTRRLASDLDGAMP